MLNPFLINLCVKIRQVRKLFLMNLWVVIRIRWEVAEISTPVRDMPRLLDNLTEVVAGLKNSMDAFNVNRVNSSAVRPRPE
jgi:hypothetical protein